MLGFSADIFWSSVDDFVSDVGWLLELWHLVHWEHMVFLRLHLLPHVLFLDFRFHYPSRQGCTRACVSCGRWLRFKSVSVRTLYLLTTTFSIRFFPTFAPSHPTNIYCKRADQNRFVKTKKIERDIAGQISSVLPSRPLRAPLMNLFQLSFLTAWFSCSFRSDLRPFA